MGRRSDAPKGSALFMVVRRVLFPPRVSGWHGSTLIASAAVSVTSEGDSGASLGIIDVSARALALDRREAARDILAAQKTRGAVALRNDAPVIAGPWTVVTSRPEALARSRRERHSTEGPQPQ